MSKATHTMTPIPAGRSVQEILPAFAAVKQSIPVGSRQLQKECACCRKLFGPARRQHQGFRLYPGWTPVAISFEYWICRACDIRYRAGGDGRDNVLAAIENFMMG